MKNITAYFETRGPITFTCASLELLKTDSEVNEIIDAETGEILYQRAPAKLFISAGNSKTGAVPYLSLPAYATCRGDAPCRKECYAARYCRFRKQSRDAYARNLDIYNRDPDSYFLQLHAAMMVTRFFRVHESGDIVDAEYFARLVETVRAVPFCRVLMFTKQYEIVNSYVATHGRDALPDNFQIVFSNWLEWECVNPYNFPTTNILLKGDELPAGAYFCGGNCFECACRGVGCWQLKAGDRLYFRKH